jgi:hypothetical protein
VTKHIYVRGVRHKTVDQDRLVLVYLMLSRIMLEQEEQAGKEGEPTSSETEETP